MPALDRFVPAQGQQQLRLVRLGAARRAHRAQLALVRPRPPRPASLGLPGLRRHERRVRPFSLDEHRPPPAHHRPPRVAPRRRRRPPLAAHEPARRRRLGRLLHDVRARARRRHVGGERAAQPPDEPRRAPAGLPLVRLGPPSSRPRRDTRRRRRRLVRSFVCAVRLVAQGRPVDPAARRRGDPGHRHPRRRRRPLGAPLARHGPPGLVRHGLARARRRRAASTAGSPSCSATRPRRQSSRALRPSTATASGRA